VNTHTLVACRLAISFLFGRRSLVEHLMRLNSHRVALCALLLSIAYATSARAQTGTIVYDSFSASDGTSASANFTMTKALRNLSVHEPDPSVFRIPKGIQS